MFGMNRGMRLSVKGLDITAQQVVGVGDELFALNDGVISSYRYNSAEDSGFVATTTASEFIAKCELELVAPFKLQEIAGGDFLKLRYSVGDGGGVGFECRMVMYNIDILLVKDVARATKHAWYYPQHVYAGSIGTDISYYKSGGNTAPLVPYLTDKTNTFIVTVFEGADEDFLIKKGDDFSAKVVGKVGGFVVTEDNGATTIHNDNIGTDIDTFGTILRDTYSIEDIKMVSTTDMQGSIVDYSFYFSPAHYTRIGQLRVDNSVSWSGYGSTGNVVGAPKISVMRVDISNSNTLGGVNLVPTSALNENIPFVTKDGVFYRVATDGTLTPMNVFTDNGLALIQKLYTNDMSENVVLGSNTGGNDVEPFCINGYSFGYGSDHLKPADFQDL